MSRLEEIRERQQKSDLLSGEYQFYASTGDDWLQLMREDIPWLLERVGELESKYREWLEAWEAADERVEELKAENEALHTALEASGERRERLEAENERLREAVKRARAYLWQADDGKGLDEMLRQATHPQSV